MKSGKSSVVRLDTRPPAGERSKPVATTVVYVCKIYPVRSNVYPCQADGCTLDSRTGMPQAQRTLQAPLSKIYLSSYTLEEVR